MFTKEEIRKALFQMNPTKALGPDGMPLLLFQKYWHIVNDSMSKDVLHVLTIGWFSLGISHTFIMLIPKKSKLENVVDF